MKLRLPLCLLVWSVLIARSACAVECIRGPYLQNAAVGSVTIRWELDRLGPSSLEYAVAGETPRKVACPFEGRKHRVTLKELRPGEKYRYSIWSGDQHVAGEYEFRATPKPVGADGKPQRFTFAVFGDFGAGTKEQLQVAKLLEQSPAELALLTGDLIYGGGEEEHYDLRFFEPYRRSLPRMTFWPALGNHDVGVKDGAAALAVFDVPANGPSRVQTGRNYSFDYGHAHIAAIDSNAPADLLKNVIGPWLEADMQASGQPWKFVFFHHPPFSSATHGEDPRIRDVMVPVFQRAHVDVVFAGHDHSYERTKPIDGITYVISGNGGQRLYPHAHPHDYTAVFYSDKHGLTLVTIDGPRLELRHVNVDGTEIDRWETRK